MVVYSNIQHIRTQMYIPSKQLLAMVDTELFTCEYEVMLFEDLRVYPEERMTPFGPLTIVDTAEVADRLLDMKKLNALSPDARDNYMLMYRELYNIMYDICDWEQITIDTGTLPLMKSVYKRLKGLV